MILISHRGNLDGPTPSLENNPTQVLQVLDKGLDCEVDVWFVDGRFMLGHDEPVYPISEEFLKNESLWCHAKNTCALEKMLLTNSIHCFWHEKDKHTLTSRGFIWSFLHEPLAPQSIIVDLNVSPALHLNCYGICVDYIYER